MGVRGSYLVGLTAGALILLIMCGAPGRAFAEDYFGTDAPDDEIQYRIDLPRTTKQRIVLASLFGGAAVIGGVGLLFHLDSRSKSDDVSAVGDHTNQIYDRATDDVREGAVRSRKLAIVGYSLGGALVLAGVVALYLTEPGSKVVSVGKKRQQEQKPPPNPMPVPVSVVPVRGGAMLAGGWSF